MSVLVDFYLGRGRDHAGRLIEEIWGYSDEELEDRHDFIQWLFPIDTPSPVNPAAPVLDVATAGEFRQGNQSAELQNRLRRSLAVMLRFYGFEEKWEGGVLTITRGENFQARAEEWVTPGNHNHLRLTRIMKCLTLCGLGADARVVLTALLEVARDFPGVITARTLAFWRGAVE